MRSTRKFYAVRKGRKTGIFLDWNECKKQVHGYGGAEFKSFTNHADAQVFLDGGTKTIQKITELKGLVGFVDGSYNHETLEAGFGCVMVRNDKILDEFSNSIMLDKHNNSRNVEGELEGALQAVHWAVENHHEKITIVYDYNGIEKWVNGEWRAKKDLTRGYAAEMRALKMHIEIDFVKVKAHSGQKYNERADYLAKEVIGLA